jgi:Domain of unknown function (DU1801)
MKIEANSVKEYLYAVPEHQKSGVLKLAETIRKNLPAGFEECMNYGMVGYVVPHSLYPSGYHCDPKLPLPFMGLAAQKNFIAFYHMGIYAKPELMDWFLNSYNTLSLKKLDAGKSCLRFKKEEDIPYDLLGELVTKMSTTAWIQTYEELYKPKKSK